MMSWNYRIFRHRHEKGDTYALHEAYYNKKGKCDGWTVEPMTPHTDSPFELLEMLTIMLRDITKSYGDILEYEPKRTSKNKRKK